MTARNQTVAIAIWRCSIWAFLLAAVLIPIAAFLVYGFFRVEGGSITYDFSLTNYIHAFGDPVYRRVLGKTLLIASEVSIICFVLGYVVAIFIKRQKPVIRYMLIFAVAIPLMIKLFEVVTTGRKLHRHHWVDRPSVVVNTLQRLLLMQFARLTVAVQSSPVMQAIS